MSQRGTSAKRWAALLAKSDKDDVYLPPFRVCVVCEEDFEHSGRGGIPKYCSEDCRRAAIRSRYTTARTCQTCGAPFHAPYAKHCSDECRTKRNREQRRETWIAWRINNRRNPPMPQLKTMPGIITRKARGWWFNE